MIPVLIHAASEFLLINFFYERLNSFLNYFLKFNNFSVMLLIANNK
ncbi:hypothetical protein GXM_04689 [Nostoc sphaeroides CCNUC1]|uniref:Uncharacterized protein n=1 Tax=Nostoc sphaeroides CCNUC1 TaxID=2653204 RepID=A0A5P8W5C4_9NOSO|nr:hypothetical protein GXM_04689 [Nostoc sphaeroides CCNUC1]